MGFVVLPALIPDITATYDVYFAAFKNDPVLRALFPNATTEDLLDPASEFRKAHTSHVLQYWHTSSTQYTLKCIDSSTNRIVGMGLWDVYPTPSDWKRGGISWLSGQERERAEALVDPLWTAREKLWANEKYVYCHVTAVHPDFQKRGIGKLLVEYGTRIAEQAGLPIYVESSREGLRLYEKTGFRRLKESVVDRGHVRTGNVGASGDADAVKNGKDEEGVELPLLVWFSKGKEGGLPKNVELRE